MMELGIELNPTWSDSKRTLTAFDRPHSSNYHERSFVDRTMSSDRRQMVLGLKMSADC